MASQTLPVRPTFEMVGAQLIANAVRRYGDSTALVYKDRRYSFTDLDQRSTRLANALSELGVGRNDRVGVLRWNDPEHFEIQLALLKIGAAMVNINPRSTPADIGWQLERSTPKVLLVASSFVDQLDALRDEVSELPATYVFGARATGWGDYEAFVSRGSSRPSTWHVTPSDLGYLRFTSGTTGPPKAVVHTQHTLAAVTRNLLLDYVPDLNRNDVFLAAQGVFHGAGWFVLPCLVRGTPFVLPDRFDPDYIERLVATHHVTVMKTVPTVLQRFIDHETNRGAPGDSLRTIVYGASPISAEALKQGMDRWGRVFVQLYGQAESPMTISVLGKEDHDPDLLFCVGYPCTYTDVTIEKVQDEETDEDIGEILVRADHNMVGYWRGPDQEPEWPWPDEWVRTGDLGTMDEYGRIFLLDRRGDMIITGGLNVYPSEVEQAIYRVDGVAEVAVVGLPDDKWGEGVTAFVVPGENANLDEARVLVACEANLARYKVPKRVVIVPELPKNAAGKIMRRRVRDPVFYQSLVSRT